MAWGTTYFFELRTKKAKDLAAAYALFFKVQEITERSTKLEQHLEDCLQRMPEGAPIEDSWRAITKIVGFGHRPEKILASELALLASKGDVDFVTNIQEVEAGHAIAFDVYDEIQAVKEIVRQKTSVVARSAESATLEIGLEEMRQLTPEMISLETGTRSLVAMLPEVANEARAVAEQIGKKLKDHYDFQHSLDYSRAKSAPAKKEADEVSFDTGMA
ncbi:MAG: hypothetical protein QNJ15_08985 [Erythrobacter sp.]|nr:hypothetical protein [Erythrobacter sp.]